MALFRAITRTFGVRCNTRSFSRLVDFFLPSISNVYLYLYNSDFSKYVNGTVPLITLLSHSYKSLLSLISNYKFFVYLSIYNIQFCLNSL